MSAASAATQAQKSSVVDGTLQIEISSLDPRRLNRTVEPIQGHCPRDEPAWTGYTMTDCDRRLLEPNSLRYTWSSGSTVAASCKNKDGLARVIYKEVRQVLLAHKKASEAPSILFDINMAGEACIDLVFRSGEACITVFNGMPKIKLTENGRDRGTFTATSWSTSLSGSTFAIDCLRLPFEAARDETIIKSLACVVGKIGSVIGLGRLRITAPIEGLVSVYEPRVRVYVRLSRASMALPFAELLANLPSHFVWHGVPYRLVFPGAYRRKDVKLSADYPLEEEQGDAQSHTHESSASDPPVASTSASSASIEIKEENASRKRSRNE